MPSRRTYPNANHDVVEELRGLVVGLEGGCTRARGQIFSTGLPALTQPLIPAGIANTFSYPKLLARTAAA